MVQWLKLRTSNVRFDPWSPSLGGEDPLEKEMAVHSNILAWKIPWTEELAGYSPWGQEELETTE